MESVLSKKEELGQMLKGLKHPCKALNKYLLEDATIDNCSVISRDKTDEWVVDGVFEGKRNFMVRIDEGRKLISFRDDLSTPKAVYDCYNIEGEQLESLYNKFLEDVKANMAEIKHSNCGGNDDYGWMDLVFKYENFSEQRLKACELLWRQYHLDVNELTKGSVKYGKES